ncbi:hypothetical protein IB277_02240 [Ensifer sp. ENS07]|uniref:DUF2946 domain-containing protein n=1 Tax=Ensifer adhaerens TaxID=106592 RepID=A0A9Q8Y7L2_ENSAD|nr:MULTISPECIES: hypothetical protein [Ensifer]KDP76008.1 hypothetical protein FA04_32600 [Ensifer adhaerens]MBD9538238.1 hypothetical protein [Ensifer sp. ENS04]MBD9592423.1 hypothetical protein [Ensifer sp. ENS05]MBD9635119.1 hypothetical protein [Ensifer sp. ENS07]MBW0365033.1 hypothetical protein [Ensifer adhaerens]
MTNLAARMLCALVLVVSALIQQPAAAMPRSPDAIAYVLPDGSLADLCLSGHDDPDGKGGTKGHGCQSCCLVAPADLPAPYPIVLPSQARARPLSVPAGDFGFVRSVLLTGAGPRAPPTVFST